MCVLQPGTDEFKKMVKGILSQLFVTLYTLTLHPSAHKQLRRHPPKQLHPPPPQEFYLCPVMKIFFCSSLSDPVTKKHSDL